MLTKLLLSLSAQSDTHQLCISDLREVKISISQRTKISSSCPYEGTGGYCKRSKRGHCTVRVKTVPRRKYPPRGWLGGGVTLQPSCRCCIVQILARSSLDCCEKSNGGSTPANLPHPDWSSSNCSGYNTGEILSGVAGERDEIWDRRVAVSQKYIDGQQHSTTRPWPLTGLSDK